MVSETLLGRVIGPEALVLFVVIGTHRAAVPAVVALDAEVIVAVDRQGGQAGARFDDALCERHAGRDARPVHLVHGDGSVAGDIAFLGRLAVPLCGGQHSQDECKCEENLLLHILEIVAIPKIRKRSQISNTSPSDAA